MLDILRRRRSVRAYTDKPVPADLVAQLKEAALRAPSSMNRQPWKFVFVTESTKLDELSVAKAQYGQFLAGAPLCIVVCGDPEASDCWIEDCSIAATILQLTATSLGLGSCWIQIRERLDADGHAAEDRTREILDLPQGLRTLCFIAVGYATTEPQPRSTDSLTWDKITEIHSATVNR